VTPQQARGQTQDHHPRQHRRRRDHHAPAVDPMMLMLTFAPMQLLFESGLLLGAAG